MIKHLWSGLIHSSPVVRKAAPLVIHCIHQFVGSRQHQTLYSDNANEFMGSCKKLMLDPGRGQPGLPHTNGSIERCNNLVIDGTATCLIAAPPCYCTYGSPCLGFNHNMLRLFGPSPLEQNSRNHVLSKSISFWMSCVVQTQLRQNNMPEMVAKSRVGSLRWLQYCCRLQMER